MSIAVTGWATINFNEFQRENSTSGIGPLTLEQSSFVVSVESIGGFIGNFAILPFNQCLGVKRMIHFLGLPLIVRMTTNNYYLEYFFFFDLRIFPFQISSLLIIWPQNVYFLYISRFLGGVSCGALIVGIPSLISDISHKK